LPRWPCPQKTESAHASTQAWRGVETSREACRMLSISEVTGWHGGRLEESGVRCSAKQRTYFNRVPPTQGTPFEMCQAQRLKMSFAMAEPKQVLA